MGNWGVHYFDAIRWMLDEQAPSSAVCMGGRYAVNDDRTIPDTAEAVFELPGGSLLVFGQYEASSNPALASGEVEFRGTEGTIYSSSKGFQVLTDKAGSVSAAHQTNSGFTGSSKQSTQSVGWVIQLQE